MSWAAECRDIAAMYRRRAECTTLAQLRQAHLDMAKRWESLAEDMERTESWPGTKPPK
jgi:hypothetical protein